MCSNGRSSAAERWFKSTYDAVSTAWTVGLAETLIGAAIVATGGVLLAFPGDGAAAHTSKTSIWLGAGPNALGIGGN
jgi:hypothetical protein